MTMPTENTPTDRELAALLADYAAPVADDGFAARVAEKARRLDRLAQWRGWLSGAALIGTAVAAAAILIPGLSALPGFVVSTASALDLSAARDASAAGWDTAWMDGVSLSAALPACVIALAAGWMLVEANPT